MFLGNGSDGDIVYSTNTSLSSDINAKSITINPGITVYGGGHRIFCQNKLIIGSGAVLSGNGSAGGNGSGGSAGGGTGGPNPIPNFTVGPGGPGGKGGSDALDPPVIGTAVPYGSGGLGGNGGGGNILAPGANGGIITGSATIASAQNSMISGLTGHALVAGTLLMIQGGTGGGGGSGASNFTYGTYGAGGGGAGGTVMIVGASEILNSGTISVNGGNGGNGLAMAGGIPLFPTGGGGGGGGGVLILFMGTYIPTGGVLLANGGNGGTQGAGGTGSSAGAGGGTAGVIWLYQPVSQGQYIQLGNPGTIGS